MQKDTGSPLSRGRHSRLLRAAFARLLKIVANQVTPSNAMTADRLAELSRFTTDVTRYARDFCLARVRGMVRIRRLEERCAELYGAGKIRGFLHLYIGEEAVATGVMPNLRPDDNVVATYREHGQALLRGVPMDGSWPRCSARSKAARAAAAARCTCSTPAGASTAATPSSAAACRWPWGWPSRTSWAGAGTA